MVKLRPYQAEAIPKMKNGCILCGNVGSGKSITSIAYYFMQQGGSMEPYKEMINPKDLYIITTAKKRDKKEWTEDMSSFLISDIPEAHYYENKVVVDSWNNIQKYKDVKNAFFIFDEQRVVGYGAWVKAFLQIAKFNNWILLTATPGDSWSDYIPVFIANGFYRNKTDFINQHVIYSRYSKYPKVDRYVNIGKLIKYKKQILIPMKDQRETERKYTDVINEYDEYLYNRVFKDRWDVYDKVPIQNAAKVCYLLRKVVNSDFSRIEALKEIVSEKGKVIVFYNYDYEKDLIKANKFSFNGIDTVIREWNGHFHEEIPDAESWIYLVQYAAGSEAWNCIETDTMVFYSLNYSYKTMEQASGRIDRINTPFKTLYYHTFKSRAPIDRAITAALKRKKNFNENNFINS